MAWIYESSLNEYDKEVTQDTSTQGRWTFKRYMYFKPDTYDNWSKGKNVNIEEKTYSFDLITNDDFPKLGDICVENEAFYVSSILSIKNLNSQEHGEHFSYCQVTVEYENKPRSNSSSTSSGGNAYKDKLPWERPVEDFTVVSQEMSAPLTEAFNDNDKVVIPATTANQPFYDLTGVYYIQKATWTYVTKSGNFSLSAPVINKSDVTLFDKIIIPAGAGLLLPPGYRRLYWSTNDGDKENIEPYEEWSFEILIDTAYNHEIGVLNAGTKFAKNGATIDICSWYVYDPNSQTAPTKEFGDYAEMMQARANVHNQNRLIKDESKKLQWFGDFVQQPIPLDGSGNIDKVAINDPSQTYELFYRIYEKGDWNLGVR